VPLNEIFAFCIDNSASSTKYSLPTSSFFAPIASAAAVAIAAAASAAALASAYVFSIYCSAIAISAATGLLNPVGS
jgi:hypothetical protein